MDYENRCSRAKPLKDTRHDKNQDIERLIKSFQGLFQ